MPRTDHQLALLIERDAKARLAWERALDPARRSLDSRKRVPYPEAVAAASVAFDAVIAEYRPQIWPP